MVDSGGGAWYWCWWWCRWGVHVVWIVVVVHGTGGIVIINQYGT